MRLFTKITIIVIIFMLGFSFLFIILSHRTELGYGTDTHIHIEDVDTKEVSTDNKTDTKPVTTDSEKPVDPFKKMDQSDFDRIMADISKRRSKEQDSITTSDETKDNLPVFETNWIPWEEYKNASPEARKAMADEFKEPGSIEAKVAQLIKEYDDNFDLEAVIAQSPELQYLREIRMQNAERIKQKIMEIENQLSEIQTRRTFILKIAEEHGATLIYDDSGNPIDYEKDEQGNPILMPVTENAQVLDGKSESNQVLPIRTPEQSNNNIPITSDIEFKVTQLWIKSAEQYPDIIISQQLSKEEYDTFFSTKELRQSLKERKTQMQNDIAQQIQNILPNSLSNREQVIFQLRKSLSENWDSDFGDAVIEQLQLDDK
ncbi:MAG: hypothetical protein OXM61_11725 [Candidatus Poribacteria bacterium]|nr:hypothetical protein [Candidatus Poribacteria bacterium]